MGTWKLLISNRKAWVAKRKGEGEQEDNGKAVVAYGLLRVNPKMASSFAWVLEACDSFLAGRIVPFPQFFSGAV